MKILQSVAEAFIEAAERTLRLAIEGRSVKRGKAPEYIQQSADFILTGIGQGSTVVFVEVPTLEQTAFQHIRQLDFWDRTPKPQETVLSLLSVATEDATSERYDSDHYDTGVLASLLNIKNSFERGLTSVEIKSIERNKDIIRLDHSSISSFQKLKRVTPEPQAVIITGKLDAIEHSTRSYRVRLPQGATLSGGIDESLLNPEKLRTLWGKEVTIKGIMHYRASGKARFIEAQVIRPYEEQDSLFQAAPQQRSVSEAVGDLRKRYYGTNVLQDIWGKWPGDEPIDELLDLLRKPNRE